MRLAVISDIHGNLDALTAVLTDIDAGDPDLPYLAEWHGANSADPGRGPGVHTGRRAPGVSLVAVAGPARCRPAPSRDSGGNAGARTALRIPDLEIPRPHQRHAFSPEPDAGRGQHRGLELLQR